MTKTTEYTANAAGANAMVADITEMFDWDDIESTNDTVTIFKKNQGDDRYVGLKVTASSNDHPIISALAYNGATVYASGTTYYTKYAAYAYGSGFFAMCTSLYSLPSGDASRCAFMGISASTNILTGDKGYCTFFGNSSSYYLFSKSSISANYTSLPLTTNVNIGAGTLLHNPVTGDVADKVMLLMAIPDTNYSCLDRVSFNGVPYTRLGRILVPTE